MLTNPQFEILCEQYLAEDFDKVISMVREVKSRIDKMKSKFPGISKDRLEFMVINTLSNFDQDEFGMTIEESDAFYDLLEQLYGIPNLSGKVEERQSNVRQGEMDYKAAMAGPQNTGDWLRTYAKHQGMNVNDPNKPVKSDPHGFRDYMVDRASRSEKPAGRPPSSLKRSGILDADVDHYLDLSIRGMRTLERAGVRTIGDMIRISKDQYLYKPNVGRLTVKEFTNKLEELVTRAWEHQFGKPAPSAEEWDKIMDWVNQPEPWNNSRTRRP